MSATLFTMIFVNQADAEGRRSSQVICKHTPDEIKAMIDEATKNGVSWPGTKIESEVLTWVLEVFLSDNCCCPNCFAEEVTAKGWDPIDAMHAVYSLAKKGWIDMLEVPDDSRAN